MKLLSISKSWAGASMTYQRCTHLQRCTYLHRWQLPESLMHNAVKNKSTAARLPAPKLKIEKVKSHNDCQYLKIYSAA